MPGGRFIPIPWYWTNREDTGGDSNNRYYRDGSAGVIGASRKDDRLGRKELILGVDVSGKAKPYPFSILDGRPVVNDSFAGQDVLVVFDSLRERHWCMIERPIVRP